MTRKIKTEAANDRTPSARRRKPQRNVTPQRPRAAPRPRPTPGPTGTMPPTASSPPPGPEAARPAHPAPRRAEQGPAEAAAPLEAGSGRPPGPKPADPGVVAALKRQASALDNAFFPGKLLAALGLGERGHYLSAQMVFDRFRRDAGCTDDPVEQMLLDQLMFAHLQVGELNALAATATALEFKQLYGNAAVRLVNAICKLVSTLADYRASRRTNDAKKSEKKKRKAR